MIFLIYLTYVDRTPNLINLVQSFLIYPITTFKLLWTWITHFTEYAAPSQTWLHFLSILSIYLFNNICSLLSFWPVYVSNQLILLKMLPPLIFLLVGANVIIFFQDFLVSLFFFLRCHNNFFSGYHEPKNNIASLRSWFGHTGFWGGG